MSKSTLNWVEDELFRICGLSDVDAAKFLISIAKEAKSKERCFKNIMKTETLEVDEKFTDELWNRVHGKHTSKPAPTETAKPPSPKRAKKVAEEAPKKDDDEEEDEWEAEEKKRKKDLEEKEAFVERLKKRDEDRTKNKFQQIDYEAARKTMEEDKEKRKHQIENLREVSRREYLKKREDDKLIELQQDIEDEKYLFGDEELTKAERAELETKQKLLKIGLEYKKVHEGEEGVRYVIPEEKRSKAVPTEYKDVDAGDHKNEQERWEKEKVHRATHFDYGAKDKGRKRKEKDYDILADDDMIDFIQAFTIKGKKSDKPEVQMSEKEKKK